MNITPERWQQIARIYELAVEHDPATRDTFVSSACGDDEALQREVTSLLSQENGPAVLDRSVWATASRWLDNGADLRPGALLGPYRIEGLLGAGGMGRVFRATDTRLSRSVAIKALTRGVAVDHQMRTRFDREARAVATVTPAHTVRQRSTSCTCGRGSATRAGPSQTSIPRRPAPSGEDPLSELPVKGGKPPSLRRCARAGGSPRSPDGSRSCRGSPERVPAP